MKNSKAFQKVFREVWNTSCTSAKYDKNRKQLNALFYLEKRILMVHALALKMPLQTAMPAEFHARQQWVNLRIAGKITINMRVTKAGKILISKNQQNWGLPKMKVSTTKGIKNDFRFHKRKVFHI